MCSGWVLQTHYKGQCSHWSWIYMDRSRKGIPTWGTFLKMPLRSLYSSVKHVHICTQNVTRSYFIRASFAFFLFAFALCNVNPYAFCPEWIWLRFETRWVKLEGVIGVQSSHRVESRNISQYWIYSFSIKLTQHTWNHVTFSNVCVCL